MRTCGRIHASQTYEHTHTQTHNQSVCYFYLSLTPRTPIYHLIHIIIGAEWKLDRRGIRLMRHTPVWMSLSWRARREGTLWQVSFSTNNLQGVAWKSRKRSRTKGGGLIFEVVVHCTWYGGLNLNAFSILVLESRPHASGVTCFTPHYQFNGPADGTHGTSGPIASSSL